MRISTLSVIAAACVLAGMTSDAAAQSGPAAVPGEIVVAFRAGVDGAERAAARSTADVRVERQLLLPGAQLVEVERGQSVDEAIAALEQRPDVRYAEPNWIYHTDATTPNDPLFGGLWGLHNTGQAVNGHGAGTVDDDIDAPEAWDRNRGSAATVVAVVDGGVAWDHPDLAPNMWSNADEIAGNGVDDDGNGRVDDVRGWDFVDRDNNPWDYNGHGTHVAGTIAARGNNGVGVTGVAWEASIMALRASDALGTATNANTTDAFTYAAANGARVVNASLGGTGQSQAMSDAIANNPNTLFVVTAGNLGQNNDTAPRYPCNYTASNLICVAATDNNDALAGFSNYGATSVDLAAPGVDINSTWPHETDSFSDNFENGLGKWTVQSGPWLTGTVAGTTWLADSPNNYADNADWAIRTSAKVDVGTRTDCALRFTYATLLQAGFDWLYVQSSADGTTWTDMSRIGDTDGAVREAFFALSAGGSRYYRFRLTSDAGVNENGVFIDDVRVSCPGGTYGGSDYRFDNGTSMAAPHVAGAAVVLFSDTPAATVAEVKKALLDGGDPVAALSGKTVSGRRLNLNTALTSLVTKARTTTTITSADPSPSVVGQAVTVRYGVSSSRAGATPTGNVTVSDGSLSCTGTVAAGQCAITFTTAGPRSLTATYAGDADHHPSTATVEHRVDTMGTTTTITSDAPDPSTIGQPVTVKFTVTPAVPGSGTPEGNVTVSDGVSSCTALASQGSCTYTPTGSGTRKLKATYGGSLSFSGSVSAEEPHTVPGIATVTAITSDDPDPSVVGQPVVVKYKVTGNVPGGGFPTGNVTVTDGSHSCTGTTAAGQCAITFTSAGDKSLTAAYAGDAVYALSPASSAVSHRVSKADTTTQISADAPDPSTVGQTVTVDFGVAAVAPGAGTPTGSVTVSDGVDSCTATVAAGQCAITFTGAGSKSLTATYAGDASFAGSSSTAEAHAVNRAGTTTRISAAAPDPSNVGQAVTVDFAVAAVAPGAGTPTGNVTVSDGVDSCTATVAAGSCQLHLTSAGARTLAASYGGNSNFNASVSPGEPHTVNRLATSTTITSDGPDPSVVGQPVTVEYSVSPSGGGTPTGNVTVSDGTASCTASVDAGHCELAFTSAGARSLTATYAGDKSFAGSYSTAEAHSVSRAATTIAISADVPDASQVAQAVTVRYTVAPVAPGAGAPSGEVTVSDGIDSCTGTVTAGSCEITLTTAGARTLTAGYAGDGNFNASSSSGESHSVSAPASPSGPPPAGDAVSARPAQISGAGLTPRTFRISAKPRLAQVSRRRARVGTTLRYTLDSAAGVRLDFTARGKQRGSLTFAGHAGLNTVRFTGWLSRTRKLTPGRYELTITATTPGAGATSQKLRFRVVR